MNAANELVALSESIMHWMRFDHLNSDVGLAILLGADPAPENLEILVGFTCKSESSPECRDFCPITGFRMLDGSQIGACEWSERLQSDIEAAEGRFKELRARFYLYKGYWISGIHPDRTPLSYFVQWARDKGLSCVEEVMPADKQSDSPLSNIKGAIDRDHVSDKLAILNQAARWWWKNADRFDRSTHPSSNEVERWLREHGYSSSLAEKAATIIRPEWAPAGRKPDE